MIAPEGASQAFIRCLLIARQSKDGHLNFNRAERQMRHWKYKLTDDERRRLVAAMSDMVPVNA